MIKKGDEAIKCLRCSWCNSTGSGNERVGCSNTNHEVKALYGAEVLTYDFYFVTNKAYGS